MFLRLRNAFTLSMSFIPLLPAHFPSDSCLFCCKDSSAAIIAQALPGYKGILAEYRNSRPRSVVIPCVSCCSPRRRSADGGIVDFRLLVRRFELENNRAQAIIQLQIATPGLRIQSP